MNYDVIPFDPQHSTAVFLGPSLAREVAKNILPANYYPPARLGDIYRLIASGVKRILLCDGVFHGDAAIWQREILSAMHAGIAVAGCASMGALRAAELYQHGMVGMGTIFHWYRDGQIDGDDEVALLHAGAEAGYRALSIPLVNIRYNLELAHEMRILDSGDSNRLLRSAQDIYFADRTWGIVIQNAGLSNAKTKNFTRFIAEKQRDLKREDVLRALDVFATEQIQSPPTQSCSSPFFLETEYLNRGFLHASLVSGYEVLKACPKEEARELLRLAARDFYLLNWAKNRQIICPPDVFSQARQSWLNQLESDDPDAWRRANGLTRNEHDLLLREQALISYLLSSESQSFGIQEMPSELISEERKTIMLITDWARQNGVAEPVDADQIKACYENLLNRRPNYFGFVSFRSSVAILRQLQYTGRAGQIVRDLNP